MPFARRLALLASLASIATLAACPPPAPDGDGTEGEGDAAEGEGEGDVGEGEGDAGEGEGDAGEGEGDSAAAPTVISTVPADDAVDVATNANLVVTWSQPIDCATAVVAGQVVLQLDDATVLPTTITCVDDGGAGSGTGATSFTIAPNAALPIDSHITAGVLNGVIADVVGTLLVDAYLWDFTTGAGADATPPTIQSRSPDAGAVDAPINGGVTVVFSESIACGTVDATSAALTLASDGSAIAAAPVCNANTITLDPAGDFAADVDITVTLAGTIADLAGNALGAPSTWTFDTGAAADVTAPAAPVQTNAPPNTLFAQVVVDGGKDASEACNVEASVNSGAFNQIVATNASATWQATLSLVVGDNDFVLRSRDAAGNVSTTTAFTIVRDALPVGDPVVTLITSPTTSFQQVIEGTKDAVTGIVINNVVVVPVNDAATTWHAEVTLVNGANVLNIKGRDASGQESNVVVEAITYNEPARLTTGDVKIEADVVSLWNKIGDESQIAAGAAAQRTDLNHFGYYVWIEGPLTDLGGGQSEACYYDDTRFQREFTRYVRTVAYSTYTIRKQGANFGCNFANTASNPTDCNGFQWEPEFAAPDWLAALVETGRWAGAPQPLPATADRRDDLGHYHGTNGTAHFFSAPDMMFDNDPNTAGVQAKPRVLQLPIIDGLTQASVNPNHNLDRTPLLSCSPACADDEHCVDTDDVYQQELGGAVHCVAEQPGAVTTCSNDGQCGALWLGCDVGQSRCEDFFGNATCKEGAISVDDDNNAGTPPVCRQESLPDWRKRLTFHWDLTDASGAKVRPGLYRVNMMIAYDHSNPGGSAGPITVWQQRFLPHDIETCWDNPAHDDEGQERAIAIVRVDGATASTQHAAEVGYNANLPVPTCAAAISNDGIPCDCGTSNFNWPCPAEPNTLVGSGETVTHFDATYRGGPGAVRVEYCPTGACP